MTLPRTAPVLGLVLIIFLLLEKMLAHSYTVVVIYVLPRPWSIVIPALVGAFGLWLILKGMGKDEVKGSLLGLLGASVVWMNWFEVGLAIRYGIGAMGVAWFIPEVLALYELFYEFYIYVDKHPFVILAMIVAYALIIRWLWQTPINPKTQRSA